MSILYFACIRYNCWQSTDNLLIHKNYALLCIKYTQYKLYRITPQEMTTTTTTKQVFLNLEVIKIHGCLLFQYRYCVYVVILVLSAFVYACMYAYIHACIDTE